MINSRLSYLMYLLVPLFKEHCFCDMCCSYGVDMAHCDKEFKLWMNWIDIRYVCSLETWLYWWHYFWLWHLAFCPLSPKTYMQVCTPWYFKISCFLITTNQSSWIKVHLFLSLTFLSGIILCNSYCLLITVRGID